MLHARSDYADLVIGHEVRFWSKAIILDGDSCWLWNGAVSGNGYGLFTIRRRNISAHKASYVMVFGEVPDGLILRHSCNVRICVNPRHLNPGTHRENEQDKIDAGRKPRGNACSGVKIRDEEIGVVLNRLKSGDSQSSIARDYGVSQALIWKIGNGKHRIYASR